MKQFYELYKDDEKGCDSIKSISMKSRFLSHSYFFIILQSVYRLSIFVKLKMLTGVDLKVRILYIGKTKFKKFFKTTYYKLDDIISNIIIM